MLYYIIFVYIYKLQINLSPTIFLKYIKNYQVIVQKLKEEIDFL